MKKISTKKLTFTALFAALIFVSSAFLQIPIPTPMGITRFHLGNTFCLIAGFLLGPGLGGLASGLGSVIFDLTNPLYFSSAPITFITKFMMGYVAGLVLGKKRETINSYKLVKAGALGQITYIVLYLGKTFIQNYFLMKLSLSATMVEIIQKGGVSLTNGIISVIIATILTLALKERVKVD